MDVTLPMQVKEHRKFLGHSEPLVQQSRFSLICQLNYFGLAHDNLVKRFAKLKSLISQNFIKNCKIWIKSASSISISVKHWTRMNNGVHEG